MVLDASPFRRVPALPVARATIIIGMNRDAIVRSIDATIERLQKARSLLTGHTAPLKRGLPYTTKFMAEPLESDAKAAAAEKRNAERKQRIVTKHMARWTKKDK